MPTILKTITTLYITICGFIIGVAIAQAPVEPLQAPVVKEITLIPLNTTNPIEATIRHYADEYGVDVETSLRIADCESKMGKYKHNWSGSSAKGIYMFIDQTWAYYCEGDVLNDEDNVKCFMKLYEENKSWWRCR